MHYYRINFVLSDLSILERNIQHIQQFRFPSPNKVPVSDTHRPQSADTTFSREFWMFPENNPQKGYYFQNYI